MAAKACLTLLLLCLAPAPPALAADDAAARENLRFGSEMAEQGNWREAAYRWKIALAEWPQNPRLLNNLAVAREALGEFEEAGTLYERALERFGGEPRLLDNLRRFRLYQEELASRAGDDGEKSDATETALPDPAAVDEGRKRGKTVQVAVGLPVPPRIDLPAGASILVASFLTAETDLLDVNRELVRFLRSEFRKRTEFDVLEVVPPPAVPEQTLDDLIANAEFWKYLSREHGADLIVSGVLDYDRLDASGFRDVDYVSRRTGQKVRQMQFVDQEEFNYALDVLFFDGPSGSLLHRDRFARSLLFAGLQNDPIAAFYELTESVSGDVLAVVTQRTRRDLRWVFRK